MGRIHLPLAITGAVLLVAAIWLKFATVTLRILAALRD